MGATLIGKPIVRIKMTAAERHAGLPKCDCRYSVSKDHPGAGPKQRSGRCMAENLRTHVCTRESGHDGSHHSHIAMGIVFSEWVA